MNIREEAEFNNIKDFLLANYSIDITAELEEPTKLIQSAVRFFLSLKTWEEYIYESDLIDDAKKSNILECISNALHIISFATLKMRLPVIMMINRNLELMAIFFFEDKLDGDFASNKATYKQKLISKYAFEVKYDIDIDKASELCEEIMGKMKAQYLENSTHLSFKNAKYYSNEKCLDIMNWSKLDVTYITNQINLMSSLINSLIILLYFDLYIEDIPEIEKGFIRNAINKRYDFKNKILDIFDEI